MNSCGQDVAQGQEIADIDEVIDIREIVRLQHATAERLDGASVLGRLGAELAIRIAPCGDLRKLRRIAEDTSAQRCFAGAEQLGEFRIGL
ncbi:hypothetical protein D3C84_1084260 [compost metagenome]